MEKAKKLIVIFLTLIMVITILPEQTEAAVGLNKTEASLYVGRTVKLKVSGTNGNVKWSSSNKKIAVVGPKGKVTGKKAGTATITANVFGKKYQCSVTIKKPYLNKTQLTLSKGTSYTLKITGTKAKTWKTSNKSVVTVSKKGKVTGKNAGTATVTCVGENGKSYKCQMIVEEGKDSGSSDELSAEKVYAAMIALKKDYPEGMKWTNNNFYEWKGGIYSGGGGCSGFAFMLSDAAFGSLPARMHKDYSNIRVGDIVRMNYDTHSVIVLEVKTGSVIVAEGNYNNSIHWGREISLSSIRQTGTYVMTRYPQ